MTSRPSTVARYVTVGLPVFALLVVPMTAYVGGYFWLGETVFWCSDGGGYPADAFEEYAPVPPERVVEIKRCYSRPWLMTIYQPAGKIEGWLRGVEVEVRWWADDPPEPIPY